MTLNFHVRQIINNTIEELQTEAMFTDEKRMKKLLEALYQVGYNDGARGESLKEIPALLKPKGNDGY